MPKTQRYTLLSLRDLGFVQGGSGATDATDDAELDALVFVSAPESPMVRMLLQTTGVSM